MTPTTIKNKLKKMSKSLKNNNIISYFPTIVEDLEYILDTFDVEITGLTEEQRINNIYDIEKYRIDYLAELIRKYMTLKWNREFNYEIIPGYLFNSTAGYNQKDDLVTVSIFGMILNSETAADYIKTLTHEFRHQLQYRFLHEKDMKGMLDYPPYFITIAKNMIPKEIITVVDEEGYVIDKPYYNDNYKRLYMEIDANNYGLEVTNTLLSDLYSMYPNKNKKLEKKVDKLQSKLKEQSEITKKELEIEGRLKVKCLDEIYTRAQITSTVIVDGKEEDALIYTDKTLKDNPIIKERYEVFDVLMNEYGFKDYWRLILDKYRDIDRLGQKDKINEIYDNIMKIDPMVTITRYITENDLANLKKFLSHHPTFVYEYKEDIDTLLNEIGSNMTIINLLSPSDDTIKMKGKKYEE